VRQPADSAKVGEPFWAVDLVFAKRLKARGLRAAFVSQHGREVIKDGRERVNGGGEDVKERRRSR
jgi:hypothetical protein